MFVRMLIVSLILTAFVAGGVAESQARVIVKEKTKFYKINGKNGQQIAASIDKRGPKANGGMHAVASVEWSFELKNPKFAIVGNQCKITDVDVHVLLNYVYPKWTGYKRASKKLRERWDKFIKLVEQHEGKHAKIILAGSRGLERSLKRARGRVSKGCSDFDASLARLVAPVMLSTQTRNYNLDRREGFRWAKVRIAQRQLLTGK